MSVSVCLSVCTSVCLVVCCLLDFLACCLAERMCIFEQLWIWRLRVCYVRVSVNANVYWLARLAECRSICLFYQSQFRRDLSYPGRLEPLVFLINVSSQYDVDVDE